MIGVDFGGTLIKAGIVENGEVVRSNATRTPVGSSPDRVLDAIADTVRTLEAKPESVGVAIPGEVDGEGKCWGLPNVPGFKGVLFGEGLSSRLGCPVAVENDATTAALGERRFTEVAGGGVAGQTGDWNDTGNRGRAPPDACTDRALDGRVPVGAAGFSTGTGAARRGRRDRRSTHGAGHG